MKINAKLSAVLAALTITCSCNLCDASSYTLTNDTPSSVFFYLNRTEQTFYKPDAYHVMFSVTKNSNRLYIGGAEAKHSFMALKPYENTSVAYDVTELPVKEPKSGLFAVSATAGAHAQNLGYWLLGVTNGQWRILVDYNKLAKEGFKPHEWNRVYGQYEADKGGFVITATTEYMPPWGHYSADLINWPTGKWLCRWNDKAQTMDLEKLAVERPAFIDGQDKAMIYMEQYLYNHPRFKPLMNGAMLSYSQHNPLPGDGLESHEIKIIEDHPTHIVTRATFIINECADILYYDVVKNKYEKVQ